ncbi:hypothetical protein DSO57_1034494 [Entomophthora muscae]|uniref:Uncharacterized protein n=1 Tax=Entomophthora muscae TaxID=34485 RepID=A0ACC2TXQ1_9FUNG|nr:hypothetical protein DSO57_1034494 [Entomophthora muscae]
MQVRINRMTKAYQPMPTSMGTILRVITTPNFPSAILEAGSPQSSRQIRLILGMGCAYQLFPTFGCSAQPRAGPCLGSCQLLGDAVQVCSDPHIFSAPSLFGGLRSI